MQMPLAQAMELLGVPADYTREDVNAAFRRAVKKAHPDVGAPLMTSASRSRRAIARSPRSARAPPSRERTLGRSAREPEVALGEEPSPPARFAEHTHPCADAFHERIEAFGLDPGRVGVQPGVIFVTPAIIVATPERSVLSRTIRAQPTSSATNT